MVAGPAQLSCCDTVEAHQEMLSGDVASRGTAVNTRTHDFGPQLIPVFLEIFDLGFCRGVHAYSVSLRPGAISDKRVATSRHP